MKKIITALLIITLLISFAQTQREIDTFNILLPQINSEKSGRPIQLITAQGGCFIWTSSEPEIVNVKGLSNDDSNCLQKGLVELNHVGAYPTSVYISTTNAQTQQLSNIPVRIKPIKKIQIIAKSRVINRNERQDLIVYAYDSDHNKITSLQGLKFKWQLKDNDNILTKISLTNSHLIIALDQRKNIQKKGAQSDIIMIKGQNPGKATVKVTCIETGYESLTHQIIISVTERFDIQPAIKAYLLSGSKFDFKLITPTKQQISLPQKQYKATVNKDFKITNTLQISTPETQSETLLKVQDIRTIPPYSSEVMVYAKKADQMIIRTEQYLIIGQKAKVDVEFYWQKHLLKGITDKIEIKTNLNYDKATKMVFADEKKVAIVRAAYKNLVAEKKIHTVLPLKAVLPSEDIILPLQETFELKIIGGSGLYDYEIKDDTIASISGSGVINSRREGRTTINVVDKKTLNNKIVLNLIVMPLDHLIPLENHKELNKNQFGSIFTLGQTKDYKFYTKCSQQSILMEVGHLPQFQLAKNSSFTDSMKVLKNKILENSFVEENLKPLSLLKTNVKNFIQKFNIYIKGGDISIQELTKYVDGLQNYGICSAHSVKSHQKYDSLTDIYFQKNNTVRSKFNLRVYEQITNNIEGTQNQNRFIMTPLASLEWRTFGGSYQWDKPTKTFINSTLVQSKYPRVECPAYETSFHTTIMYINHETKHLLIPVSQKKNILVECKYPTSLKIKYERFNADEHILKGLKGQIIRGQLIPVTSKKQTFYNASNLIYESQKTHGVLKMFDSRFEYDPKVTQKITKVTFWTESIKGLKGKFIKASTYFEYETKDLFEIEHYPVSKNLLMLFNPKNIYSLNLTKISENYEIICNGSISCVIIEQNRSKLININTSRYGQGYFSVRDKNIYSAPALQLFFEVVDADQLKLKIHKKSIQLYNETVAEVELFYKSKLIPTWQYEIRNILLVHESGIRSQPITNRKNKFIIRGDKPGIYHIQAEQHFPTYLQSSSSVSITVYPRVSTNIQNLSHKYLNGVLHYYGEIMIAVNCYRLINIIDGPSAINVKNDMKDEVIALKHIGQSFRNYRIQGLEKGKTTLLFNVTSVLDNVNLAVIQVIVNVKPIEYVAVYSLDQAIINAQFRILPHLVIDGKVLLDSVCDLEYEWKTSPHVIIKAIKNKAGVNATAIKQGDGLIQLNVLNNKGQTVLYAKKSLKVHKSLDLELPTIIGEENKKQFSTDLLLPPNSGYSFDENFHLTKISSCDDGTLLVKQNRLVTSREKGVVSIKIQKHNDQTYNNFLNVIITDIRALFIQNQYSQVTAELGQVKKLKFYLQDMYGRLFYNNLFNVQFDVVSSNEDIFVASIDPSKQFINIHPKKRGQASLLLKLKSASSTNKLLEIPHDIVNIEVGKVIEPQSPIQIAVGGYVEVQYHGKATQSWQVASGSENIDVYPGLRKIVAKKVGQATVMIGGYSVIVRVVDIKLKYKWTERAQPGFKKAIAEFILNQKVEGSNSLIHSIENTYNFVNNNMRLLCEPMRKAWFSISSKIERDPQGYDKLVCEFIRNDQFDLKDQIPIKLEWSVINKKDGRMIVLQTFEVPIQPTFWVPAKHKMNILSYEQPSVNIPIKSLVPLKTSIIGGQKQWIKEWASDYNQIQILHVELDPRGLNKNFEFTINLQNQVTNQSDQVFVKFIMDESKRVEVEQKMRQQVSQQKQVHQSQEVQSSWHWTDFLILLMAFNFIGLVLCCNLNGSKYKVI